MYICNIFQLIVCQMFFDESIGISGRLLVLLEKDKCAHKQKDDNKEQLQLERKEEKIDERDVYDKSFNFGNGKYFLQSFYNVHDLQPLIIRKCEIMKNLSVNRANHKSHPWDLTIEVFNYLYGEQFIQQFMFVDGKQYL